MPSLTLVVFVLQLVIHLVNTVGAPVIDDFLWSLYNKLPTPTSKDAQSQIGLRRELIALKRELNATSSQDQFAKWAKLRRQHDKKQAEYDEKTNGLKTFKSTFDRTIQALRFLSTNGLRFFLQFWYSKQPMFWIPLGWVPWYIEWALSFPRAPMGSVSIQIWGIACITVVQMVGAAVVTAFVLESKGPQMAKKEEPMKMEAGVPKEKPGKEKPGKKEL